MFSLTNGPTVLDLRTVREAYKIGLISTTPAEIFS